MTNEYKFNHYVPIWYQKRFIPEDQKNNELFYLDLKPKTFVDPRGIEHEKKSLYHQGFKFCFVEEDLYTTQLGIYKSTDVEKFFFGKVDHRGRNAIEAFSKFSHPWNGRDAYRDMIRYMSLQKLRTPKGLGWLSEKSRIQDHQAILKLMMRFQQLFCAIWTECVWLIADASKSETKFIISDHPVTVYNRRCGPRSQWCRGFNDPVMAVQTINLELRFPYQASMQWLVHHLMMIKVQMLAQRMYIDLSVVLGIRLLR